jgi:threonine/homoserine/homoserine lactone efflux protein
VGLNLTPGPDMLYVLGRSIGQGRRAGVVSALGIGAGTLVHTLAAAFGLGALLLSSALAFDLIRLAGAAYLLVLGARLLLARGAASGWTERKPATYRVVFRQAVLTNVLNPKVGLFFLAFLPQFVDRERGDVAAQIIALGLLFNLSGTSWNRLIGLLAGTLGAWLRRSRRAARVQRWVSGTIFMALGLRLTLGGRGQ